MKTYVMDYEMDPEEEVVQYTGPMYDSAQGYAARMRSCVCVCVCVCALVMTNATCCFDFNLIRIWPCLALH